MAGVKPSFHRCSLASLLAAAALLLVTACGDPEVGEECDDAGSSTECEDGAICTNEAGKAICRAHCVEQEECPPGFSCNGVSGTNVKSCQPGD
jgi:hypothetical protein